MYLYLPILKNKCIPGLLFLGSLLLNLNTKSYGQRIYADAEQHSSPQSVTPLLILSEVTDAGNAVNSNYNDRSSLYVSLGLLGIIYTTQNLQFTDPLKPKPDPTSPLTFKISLAGGTSILTLIGGTTLTLTDNTNPVGMSSTSSEFLNLLNLLNLNTPKELTLQNPNVQYDGLQLQSKSVLAAGSNAYYYYAFFIATPKIGDTSISGCTSSLTLTLQNSNTAGIRYKLYTDTVGYATGTAVPIDSFAHTYTLSSANLPAAGNNKSYYLIAEDHNTTGNTYYSAWKKFTITKSALPSAPVVTGDTICSGTSPVLGITTSPGFTYNVYDLPTGGSLLGSTSTNAVLLPAITANKTYYVSVTETATGCISASRTSATVTVKALPSQPAMEIE